MFPWGWVPLQSGHCTVPRPRGQVLQTERGSVSMQPPVLTLPVTELIFLPTAKSTVKWRQVYFLNADLKYVRSPLVGISCFAPVRYGRKFSDCILKNHFNVDIELFYLPSPRSEVNVSRKFIDLILNVHKEERVHPTLFIVFVPSKYWPLTFLTWCCADDLCLIALTICESSGLVPSRSPA